MPNDTGTDTDTERPCVGGVGGDYVRYYPHHNCGIEGGARAIPSYYFYGTITMVGKPLDNEPCLFAVKRLRGSSPLAHCNMSEDPLTLYVENGSYMRDAFFDWVRGEIGASYRRADSRCSVSMCKRRVHVSRKPNGELVVDLEGVDPSMVHLPQHTIETLSDHVMCKVLDNTVAFIMTVRFPEQTGIQGLPA